MLATASWSEIVPKHTSIFQVGKSFILPLASFPHPSVSTTRHPHHSPWHRLSTQVLLTPQFPPMLGPESPTTTFMVLPRHSSNPCSFPESQHPAVWGLPKFRRGTSKSQDGYILAGLFSLHVLPYCNHAKEHHCDASAASAQKSAEKKNSFSHLISLPTNGSWRWIIF